MKYEKEHNEMCAQCTSCDIPQQPNTVRVAMAAATEKRCHVNESDAREANRQAKKHQFSHQ